MASSRTPAVAGVDDDEQRQGQREEVLLLDLPCDQPTKDEIQGLPPVSLCTHGRRWLDDHKDAKQATMWVNCAKDVENTPHLARGKRLERRGVTERRVTEAERAVAR